MTGESVNRHHLNPGVHAVERTGGPPPRDVCAQAADVAQRVGMEEDLKVGRRWFAGGRRRRGVGPQVERVEALGDGVDGGGREARGDQDAAQGIDVAAGGGAVAERRFDERRAAPHERVVHQFAGAG